MRTSSRTKFLLPSTILHCVGSFFKQNDIKLAMHGATLSSSSNSSEEISSFLQNFDAMYLARKESRSDPDICPKPVAEDAFATFQK